MCSVVTHILGHGGCNALAVSDHQVGLLAQAILEPGRLVAERLVEQHKQLVLCSGDAVPGPKVAVGVAKLQAHVGALHAWQLLGALGVVDGVERFLLGAPGEYIIVHCCLYAPRTAGGWQTALPRGTARAAGRTGWRVVASW